MIQRKKKIEEIQEDNRQKQSEMSAEVKKLLYPQKESNGWIIRRVIALICLVLVAVLPKNIRGFQDIAASIIEKILGSLVFLGGVFLIWFFVALVFMVLNAVFWTAWTKVSRKNF